jgi:hypothetical protein
VGASDAWPGEQEPDGVEEFNGKASARCDLSTGAYSQNSSKQNTKSSYSRLGSKKASRVAQQTNKAEGTGHM